MTRKIRPIVTQTPRFRSRLSIATIPAADLPEGSRLDSGWLAGRRVTRHILP